MTELGNAERLVTRYGTQLRYCHAQKKWLVWDGKRWRVDDKGAVEWRAQRTVRAINDEVAKADEEVKGAIEAHARRSETKYKIDAMIALARSLEIGRAHV